MSAAADFQAQREAMAELSRQAVADLDAQIEQTEAHLRDLKTERQEAVRILHVMDPNSRPKPKPGPKSGGKPASFLKVNADTLAKIEAYLRKTLPDKAFTASEVARRDDYDLTSEATVRNALLMLQDRGVLRLDRMGKQGAKFYRFTAAGG